MAYLPQHPTPFLHLTKSCIAKHAVLFCNRPCDTKRFTICSKESLSQWVVVGLSDYQHHSLNFHVGYVWGNRVTINQIIHPVCYKMHRNASRWRIFKSYKSTSETCDVRWSEEWGSNHSHTSRPAPFALVHGQGLFRVQTRFASLPRIFTPQSEQWRIREQYFSRKQANTRTSNEIYHAKHTQNGFNPKPDIQLTSFTTIPVPCLRLHRSWEALVPRPLRQKPTFLIATRWGKNCEMANPAWLVTVKTPILGCITNLMKSTHWKPVNIVNVQNVQLGFMLTTSLVEARLSVMSTLGSRQERSSHRRHKKKYTTT